MKSSVGRFELHSGVGHFGLKVKLNSFGRLNLDHEPVGSGCVRDVSENIMIGGGRNWITICDVRQLIALPRAQIERHALPAPVVDLQLDRGEGRGLAARRDALGSSR